MFTPCEEGCDELVFISADAKEIAMQPLNTYEWYTGTCPKCGTIYTDFDEEE